VAVRLGAIDPARKILGLDHEDAEARNHDVVDLRRAALVRQRDVTQDRVLGRMQLLSEEAVHGPLAPRPLARR
jgi:hypothetical protein